MKLFEYTSKAYNDFFAKQEEIDAAYNKEAHRRSNDQRERYAKQDGNSTPVIIKAEPEEESWGPIPDEEEEMSAGYRGLQNVKRVAGHDEYDKEVDVVNPHDEPLLPADLEELIRKAKKRLHGY